MSAVANAASVGANLTPTMAVRAQEILQQCMYPALWTVSCQQINGALILRGSVPNYYLKQLAQVLVAKALGGGQILNEIDVDDPCSATNPPFNRDQGQHARHTRHSRTHSRRT
jgi:hypothetical protein